MSAITKINKTKSAASTLAERPSGRLTGDTVDTMRADYDDDGAMFFPVSPEKPNKGSKRAPTPRSSGRQAAKASTIKTYFSTVQRNDGVVDAPSNTSTSETTTVKATPELVYAPPESLVTSTSTSTSTLGKSIALIMFNDTGFSVNDEALNILNGLDGPISVVAVAGLYRTGKSFLLNRVVLDQACAFTVGPTTRACTKGIWMWSQPIVMTNPATGTPINILVIDTEGIGAPTADATHDTRIFALGLLLSSYFIYNSVGSIDEQALSNMSLVTNLSRKLRSSASSSSPFETAKASAVNAPHGCSSDSTGESNSEAEQETDSEAGAEGDTEAGASKQVAETHSFPGFLWVVRDFALQLRDDNGQPIGPREYLEDALGATACGRGAPAKNRIRKCLRDYFPDRDCFTLVRPCINEAQLQTLDSLPNKVLRPEFVAQAQELRTKIFTEAVSRPMMVNGCLLTASMLGMLCQSYVRAVNEGKVPDIKDAWAYVCDAQKTKLEQRAVLDFNERVNMLCNEAMLSAPPITPVQTPAMFLRACHKVRKDVLRVFRRACAALYGEDCRKEEAPKAGAGARARDATTCDTFSLDQEIQAVLIKTSLRFQKQYLQFVQDTVDRVGLNDDDQVGGTATGMTGVNRNVSMPGDLPSLQANLNRAGDRFLAKFIIGHTSAHVSSPSFPPSSPLPPSFGHASTSDVTRFAYNSDGCDDEQSMVVDPESDSLTGDDVYFADGGATIGLATASDSVDMVSLILNCTSDGESGGGGGGGKRVTPAASGNVWTVARLHYDTNAHLVWGRKAYELLWTAVSAQYGGMEQELARLREEHAVVQQQTVNLASQHEALVHQLEGRHRDELDKKMAAQKELGLYFEAELNDKSECIAELQRKLDEAGRELLTATSDITGRIGNLEQDGERERMRAETAEKEVTHLKEEVEELTQEAGVIIEQTRYLSEMTLEQNRLRQELAESKRALQEQKRTLASVESAFKKESKEVQSKVLQSLQTMKETRKVEQAQMRAAKDAAQARCLTMESDLKALTAELMTVKTQQAESLAAHELQVHVIRTQMEDNELRGCTHLRDVSAKLQESEKQRKEKEKVMDALQTRFREERLRLEQEYMQKTKEMESRAVNAENQVNEHRRQVEAADERWARKRARTDDSADKSLQLVKVEAELVWQRQNKSDADAQLIDLRRQNHELEQTIRGLERGIDSQMTRAKLEYESKLAALEHRLATLTDA